MTDPDFMPWPPVPLVRLEVIPVQPDEYRVRHDGADPVTEDDDPVTGLVCFRFPDWTCVAVRRADLDAVAYNWNSRNGRRTLTTYPVVVTVRAFDKP